MQRIVFFFSGRRRRTRYWRDWSSDVCSSDLRVLQMQRHQRRAGQPIPLDLFEDRRQARPHLRVRRRIRSEERRVGKEARSRLTAADKKKKGMSVAQKK